LVTFFGECTSFPGAGLIALPFFHGDLIMRKGLILTLLILFLFPFFCNAQTLEEARAKALENLPIADMILADPGKYPGANITDLTTYVYYVRNVSTAWNTASLLNTMNSVFASAIANVKFPLIISLEVPDFDFLALFATVMDMVAIPLAYAIGVGLSLFLIYLIYRKTKNIVQSTG